VRPVAQVIAEETIEGEVTAQPFETRDHQIEGWDALWCARAQGAGRALVHLATGGGKTTLSAVDLMKYREECALMNTPVIPRALYVSHKREINDQAAETMRRFMPDLEEHFFDTRKANNRPEADITYAPIQSLYSKLDTFDPDEFEYIIWDEAHHLPAETYNKVLEYFNPLFEYALTATPDRADGKDIRDYFGEAIFSKGLAEGIAEGWLAEVDYHIVFDKAIKDEVKAGFHPKTLKEIKELFEKKASPEALAESIQEEIEKLGLENPKTMVLCESIEEADEMASLLGGVSYHSGTSDRPEVLKDFKQGRKRIITAKDMFNEGVDVPDVKVVIFLRATASDAVFLQQLGRGLRKIPGKDKLFVLDFVANVERIAKVRELSKAIQQRAQELGDIELSERGDGAEQDGLHIHSRHGDFDFDTLAVDLLEKWGVLRGQAVPNQLNELSDKELVALALSLKPSEALHCPEIEDLSARREFVSLQTIYKRFGSLSEFQKACGFEILDRIDSSISDGDLITLARHISPSAPLTPSEIIGLSKEGRFLSAGAIRRRFGSIDDFQLACGFKIKDLHSLSNEELITLALQLKPGGVLTQDEINQLSRDKQFLSQSTIYKRFGSLSEFQKACGLDKTMTQQDLIDRALAISPQRPLSENQIGQLSKDGDFPSKSTIRKLFGNLSAFQTACGFEVKQKVQNSLSQANAEDLIVLAQQLSPGRPMQKREMEALSAEGKFVSANKIQSAFGSIAAFQRACGFDVTDRRRAT
jgi:superfamily II DNA or RNA helicase